MLLKAIGEAKSRKTLCSDGTKNFVEAVLIFEVIARTFFT
jgi:hypothetical protein